MSRKSLKKNEPAAADPGLAFCNPRLAYIKVISPKEARALGLIIPADVKLPPNAKLFALCTADGTTLGITDERSAAYGAAIENDFVPVSVH